MSWTRNETIYEPVGRDGLSTVQVGDYLYMWGGDQDDLPSVHNNEEKKSMCSVVEVCHVPTGEWVQKSTTGDPAPLGVYSYAAAVIRNEILFYGGYCNHDDCYHNSLYSFNVDTFSWKELSPTTSHHGPMMKAYSGMVAVRIATEGEDYLVIIGGYGSSNITPPQPGAQYSKYGIYYQRCNEVHMYRLKTGEWTSPTVTGDRPPPIDSFTLTSITNTTAILFGGYDGDRWSNDVYAFEFTDTSVKCTKFSNPGGSVQWPKERWNHSSVLINCSSGPHLLVVGGIGGERTTNDSWLLNINKMEWKELTNIPDSVTDRYFHSVSVWNETQSTHWIIEFGGWMYVSDTRFTEMISITGDLVVESVLDINEYQRKRVLERLAQVNRKDHPVSIEDILDKEPKLKDLHRLFDSSAAHYSTIGTALDVEVEDLSHSEKAASDKLLAVFKRWIESNKGVSWRNALQVCEDYPDKFGRVKAGVDKFLESDRARKEYLN